MILVASDVTPTDRWLNVWCIWHTKVETLQEFRSGHRIGWIIQDFWETCVAFFNVPLGNKDAVAPNPLTKEESHRVYNCDDEHLSGSTKRWIFLKVCEIFKVRSIESLKYVWEFYTPVCYCGDISMPWNVTLNETNCDWLFDMSVKRPHGRALANESCHGFQTLSRQSEGLATWDYDSGGHMVLYMHVLCCFTSSSRCNSSDWRRRPCWRGSSGYCGSHVFLSH